tara:strand:+ start:304 stop:678 length:375 start_codon:yes stop_codon:yes gene_type:complete
MKSLNSLLGGYKGGSKKTDAKQLTPSPKPSPTLTSEQMVEVEDIVSKMDLNKNKKQPIDVKENRQINAINNDYKNDLGKFKKPIVSTFSHQVVNNETPKINKKQPIDVKENRQINTINNGYKQK